MLSYLFIYVFSFVLIIYVLLLFVCYLSAIKKTCLTIFLSKWFNRNIIGILSIFDKSGNFLSYEEFNRDIIGILSMFDKSGNFLTYEEFVCS